MKSLQLTGYNLQGTATVYILQGTGGNIWSTMMSMQFTFLLTVYKALFFNFYLFFYYVINRPGVARAVL